MFDLLIIVAFIWLSSKVFGLALKVTWGLAKVIAAILSVLAIPLFVLFLLFASGAILLVPIALIAVAWGILRSNS